LKLFILEFLFYSSLLAEIFLLKPLLFFLYTRLLLFISLFSIQEPDLSYFEILIDPLDILETPLNGFFSIFDEN
jgi:hypothetical protein